MAGVARKLPKDRPARPAKSEHRPQSGIHEHSFASLEKCGGVGGKNAGDGASFVGGKDSKWLHRFLVERRHPSIEVNPVSSSTRSRPRCPSPQFSIVLGDSRAQ